MRLKAVSRAMTHYMAMLYIIAMCLYSSVLLGTLAHELMHKSYSCDTHAIEVNYDGSGMTYAGGAVFNTSHEWVYLNGFIIQTILIMVSLISIMIIMRNKN